jgi:hypothetical protein
MSTKKTSRAKKSYTISSTINFLCSKKSLINPLRPMLGCFYYDNCRKGGARLKTAIFTLILAMSITLLVCGIAYAADITPDETPTSGDWWERSQGSTGPGNAGTGYLFTLNGTNLKSQFTGNSTSTHPQGTWNSPYTNGVDGYNYNDPQDYTNNGSLTNNGSGVDQYSAGPHGGYLTSTHKCRECHAVHRAAGKFKLRFEACDWCHGTGAGSGYNIQMDNDDDYTEEYNVGHSLGYGLENGKWKAPDDTYPAYTPNYWLGGFACFDCHSPHANPRRLLGFRDNGTVWDDTTATAIANPGHDDLSTNITGTESLYPAGSWILIKDPDEEIAVTTDTLDYYSFSNNTDELGITDSTTIVTGEEISDIIAAYQVEGTTTVSLGVTNQYSLTADYPVNKFAIDWDRPIGPTYSAQTGAENMGFRTRAGVNTWSVSEFCTDCHDGNAGVSTVQAPLFSEDRALRNQGADTETPVWQGNYDLAYGHDSNPRHSACQMKFNPEDSYDFGPDCRTCHRGSSDCGICHSSDRGTDRAWRNGYSMAQTALNIQDTSSTVAGYQGASWFSNVFTTVDGYDTTPTTSATTNSDEMLKHERSVDWTLVLGGSWRTSESSATTLAVNTYCSNDGFSWPHRTLGWKMLKDDLFGLDFDGTVVNVGEARNGTSTYTGYSTVISASPLFGDTAHDLDSVCLDCHNPTIWNAVSGHEDTASTTSDDFDDELILRGLP